MPHFSPLCEVCNQSFTGKDLEDGVTVSADCCERIGLCAHCRQPGKHDCDPGSGGAYRYRGPGLVTDYVASPGRYLEQVGCLVYEMAACKYCQLCGGDGCHHCGSTGQEHRRQAIKAAAGLKRKKGRPK